MSCRPRPSAALDAAQRRYLGALAERGGNPGAADSGEAWQNLIFEVAAEDGLPNGQAFAALYAAFLGRANGPRAGWLLASLDSAMVLDRLAQAATGSGVAA